MPRTRKEMPGPDPRWWLLGGEFCEFCLQEYSLTIEYRCVECDRPVCPCCTIAAVEERQFVCPECASQSRPD